MWQKLHNGLIFLFLSNYANDEYYQEASNQNMLAFVEKPIDKYTLKSIIDRNLKLHNPANFKVSQEKMRDFIMIKTNKVYQRIPIGKIRYIEASGNYCFIYTQATKYLVKKYLSHLTRKFDPNIFLRIHRSYTINIDYLKTVNIDENTIQLDKDEILPVSSKGKKMLLSLAIIL